MHIEFNLSNILEVIAIFVSGMCGKVDLDSKKLCKIISSILSAFSISYLLLSCLTLENYFIAAVLRFSQIYWKGICLYILFFALIPPTAALWEQKKKNARIEKSYVMGNTIFNIAGAFSACAMFGIAHYIIRDFSCLKEFKIEKIVSILIPACVWLVLAYQSIEQQKKLPDHDADTKLLNQKLNMLHLFHAFFFSALSVVLIVCYSIYCYIHNLQLEIHYTYFILLTLALAFFYLLSQHFHRHVYMVFVVMVPVILVSSVYWMSWFSMSIIMRFLQWLFIVIHSLVYAVLIFYRYKMIFIGKPEEMEAGRSYGKTHRWFKGKVFAIERGFQGVMLSIVIICYSVSWLVPMLVQRVDGNMAEIFIIKVCRDTDVDADEMIALAKEQGDYDAVNQDYDRDKYLKFMYEELYEQILDKGIINEDSKFLIYEDLRDWCAGM
ncbi:MAG: hypothetical protein HDR03_06860 [Lachnospiraceae bacterium]|nr:hypothetical protein [Lachnospiraceae bacterium]